MINASKKTVIFIKILKCSSVVTIFIVLVHVFHKVKIHLCGKICQNYIMSNNITMTFRLIFQLCDTHEILLIVILNVCTKYERRDLYSIISMTKITA